MMERIRPIIIGKEMEHCGAGKMKEVPPKPWRWQVLAWVGLGKPRIFSHDLKYRLEWPGGKPGGVVVLGRFYEQEEGLEGELYKRELYLYGIKAGDSGSHLDSVFPNAGWTLHRAGHIAAPTGDSPTYYHLPADWPYFIEAVTEGWTYGQHLEALAKLAFPEDSPCHIPIKELVKAADNQRTAIALATDLCPYARMNEMVRRLETIADILDEQLDRKQALGGVLLDMFGGNNTERQIAEKALDRLLEAAYQAGVVLRPAHLASSGFKSR